MKRLSTLVSLLVHSLLIALLLYATHHLEVVEPITLHATAMKAEDVAFEEFKLDLPSAAAGPSPAPTLPPMSAIPDPVLVDLAPGTHWISQHARGRGAGRGRGTGAGAGTLSGIRVEGSLVLVCDLSGSMHRDLPQLLKELAEKFPDAQLITSPGCSINRALGTASRRASSSPFARVLARQPGMDPLRDTSWHARSMLDALELAASLEPKTVIFNCDLNDFIRFESLHRLAVLYQGKDIRLCCRSVHREAPPELLEVIHDTGGVFRLDPIGRRAAPAIPVFKRRSANQPMDRSGR